MWVAPVDDEVALTLVSMDPALVEAWDEGFAAWPSSVRVQEGRLEDVEGVDAFITAGNSYGQMDGGVDRAVAQHFPAVQRAVWAAIADDAHGYLPVGSAVVVPTGSDEVRWLVYAPTMRVPMSLRGALDVAVHDGFWAALVAVAHHNRDRADEDRIAAVACPGFGTGFGQVEPARAARLMATAYRYWRAGPTAQIADREQDLDR